MPFLDHQRDSLIVRIVYDGPPFSGKTTTLRALGAGAGRVVETPEEHDGRTLYFDWLDYTAGSFDGRPIRCQIVSVPGQRGLAQRRRNILKEADAVVFVADTGSLGMELSLKYASDLAAIIAYQEAPRPGVVVQANKRDAPDANPMMDVERAFRDVGIEGDFVEATANTGSGVREAFLCAVRLALHRAREMISLGTLAVGRPAVDSSRDLLQSLVALDDGENGPAERVDGARREAARFADAALVRSDHPVLRREDVSELQNAPVPRGLIWPPVDGRQYLHQALVGELIESHYEARDSVFVQSSSGWCIHSRHTDVFEDQAEGRIALTRWARLHALDAEFLTDRRCVVLSPLGSRWQLWQIYCRQPSLLECFSENVTRLAPRELAEHLLGLGRTLVEAAATLGRAAMPLPITFATIGGDPARPKYVDKSPGFDSEEGGGTRSSAPSVDMRSLVSQIAGPAEASMGTRVCREVVTQLKQLSETSPEGNEFCVALIDRLSSSGRVPL